MLLAVTIVGGAWIAGREDSGPTPLLSALRSDPIARYEPPGARLTGTREQDQGSSLGKAFKVHYARDFSVPGGDADAALTAALRAAQEAGWQFDGPPSEIPGEYGTTNGSLATRTILGGQSATLTIVLSTPPNASPSTPRTLQINVSA